MATITTRMQQRRDTSANWATNNPVLLLGEFGYDTDEDKFKVGDGVSYWSAMPFLLEEEVEAAQAAQAAAEAAAATAGTDAATAAEAALAPFVADINDQVTAAGAAAAAAEAAAASAAEISGLDDVEGAVDLYLPTQVGDTGTPIGAATAEAMGDQADTPGTPLREAIGERATITDFFDDFSGKAAATIAVGGSYTSDSGHTVNVTGQLPLEITGTAGSRRGTHTRTNTATAQSTYLTVDLGGEADDLAGYLWTEYEVPAGADPQQSLVQIFPGGIFGPPNFTDAAAHTAFGASSFRYDTLQALGAGAFTTTILKRGQWTALTPGTYRIATAIDGTHAYITAPDGRSWAVPASALVAARTTRFVCIQLYNDVGTFKALKLVRWGAEVQRRTARGPYASAADVARVAARPGRVLAAVQTSGPSTAIPLTTSLSAKLVGATIPICSYPGARLLVEFPLWMDQSIPIARSTSALLAGAYLGGGTSFGKLTTVQSGYTPANATPSVLTGSKTHDWALLADGAMASTTVTVTGAILGGVASASINGPLPAGMQLTAAVTAADTVTVTLINHSGSTQDLSNATLTARVTTAQTAYADGHPWPFYLILDVDPAFTDGDLIEVQLKAQASLTNLFTFIDSGDATGGTSTLRRSLLKITELGAAS